ncbi:MAG: TVP38/TMEM64 family protein [Nitrospirota bacterium]|nr:TVP38/TMEM64 family protein [Nitrospirota bacterium]MDE3241697.1 TVP38/TMEM64 family protein [Nitrospirota bacterium]
MIRIEGDVLMQPSVETIPAAGSFNKGKLIIALLFAATIGGFFYFDLGRYLSLESLKANRDGLLVFTDQHYGASVAIFILSYCLLVSASLPGAVFFTLAGGLLFGSLWGTLYVNLGATSGATLAFLASRYLLRDWVEAKFGRWLGPFQEGFAKNGFSYLMTIRLIPVAPFFIVNALFGLTKVSLRTYVTATAIGIIPGSFVYAYAGRQLGTINSLKEIASPNVLLAFTLLGVLALVPTLYQKFAARQRMAAARDVSAKGGA